ncbi:MAG TPA: cytochrome c peroxidase, partial [Xanthobacteraceae bacterium]|nr:cytochrome c peroxidase [Xanthobacteraceae bacterium]
MAMMDHRKVERTMTTKCLFVLWRIKGYGPLFAAAFPTDSPPMTVKNMAKAIVAYERTLLTPTPFDA